MNPLFLFAEQPLVRAFGWSLLHFVWQGAIIAGSAGIGAEASSRPITATPVCRCLLRPGVDDACASPHICISRNRIARCRSCDDLWHSGPRPRDHSSQQLQRSRGLVAEYVCGIHRSFVAVVAGNVVCRSRLLPRQIQCGVDPCGTNEVDRDASSTCRVATDLSQSEASSRNRTDGETGELSVGSGSHPVIGWLKPVVLIPLGCLTGLSPAQIEAIFAHELAHIRRHDYLVSVGQSLVEAILFYHPAVWWVSKQVRQRTRTLLRRPGGQDQRRFAGLCKGAVTSGRISLVLPRGESRRKWRRSCDANQTSAWI